jgi:hypothetical protein
MSGADDGYTERHAGWRGQWRDRLHRDWRGWWRDRLHTHWHSGWCNGLHTHWRADERHAVRWGWVGSILITG